MHDVNLLIACDQNYYDQWAVPCLKSLRINAQFLRLHCFIVNPGEVTQLPDVEYHYAYKKFINDNHRVSYLQSARFIAVSKIFPNDELVATIDCDTICIKKFTKEEFISIAENHSVLAHGKSGKWLAGFVTYGRDDFRFEFAKMLTEPPAVDFTLDDWYVESRYGGWDQFVLDRLSGRYGFQKLPDQWMAINKNRHDCYFYTIKGNKEDFRYQPVYDQYKSSLGL
jgi:hypothetical protein